MARIIKFACIIGLRPSEVVECVRLLNSSNIRHYYNRERQALEHYRFPSIFLRQTKKAYVSFVTPEMLELVGNGSIYRGITYNDIASHVGPQVSSAICASVESYLLRG